MSGAEVTDEVARVPGAFDSAVASSSNIKRGENRCVFICIYMSLLSHLMSGVPGRCSIDGKALLADFPEVFMAPAIHQRGRWWQLLTRLWAEWLQYAWEVEQLVSISSNGAFNAAAWEQFIVASQSLLIAGPGWPHWLATMKNDLSFHNLTVEDAAELALYRPLDVIGSKRS